MLVPVKGIPNPSEANRRNRAIIPSVLRNQDPNRFPPVYIFNIYDRSHVIPFGGFGTRTILACPKDAEYSEALVLDAMVLQEYDLADGSGNMSFTAEDGMEVARDLIGVNSSSPGIGLYTTNLEWWGVFATRSEKPLRRELDAARAKLTKMMQFIFENGKALAQEGPLGLNKIGPNHYRAAEYLNLSAPWATVASPMERCPVCKESIQPEALKCRFCGHVIGEELPTPAAKK